jgi:hypothetical protein
MLKLEPREAMQIVLPASKDLLEPAAIAEAVDTMRTWRHYASLT